jgi:hypothetical protein
MHIIEGAKCTKCGERAFCMLHKKWFCGKCYADIAIKLQEKQEKEMMEIIG